MMIRNTGFTLIELIVTLAIAAILITVAGPNFLAFIQSNRLTAQANEMVGSLQLARSEAVKRDKTVTVCRSTNPTVSPPALPSCSTTSGTTWETGWVVFVDNNTNGSIDAGELLQQHEALSGRNTTLDGSTPVNDVISFTGTGFVASKGTLALCDYRKEDWGKEIKIDTTGHISTISTPPAIKTCAP